MKNYLFLVLGLLVLLMYSCRKDSKDFTDPEVVEEVIEGSWVQYYKKFDDCKGAIISEGKYCLRETEVDELRQEYYDALDSLNVALLSLSELVLANLLDEDSSTYGEIDSIEHANSIAEQEEIIETLNEELDPNIETCTETKYVFSNGSVLIHNTRNKLYLEDNSTEIAEEFVSSYDYFITDNKLILCKSGTSLNCLVYNYEIEEDHLILSGNRDNIFGNTCEVTFMFDREE